MKKGRIKLKNNQTLEEIYYAIAENEESPFLNSQIANLESNFCNTYLDAKSEDEFMNILTEKEKQGFKVGYKIALKMMLIN